MHVFMLNGDEGEDFYQLVFTIVGTCKCALRHPHCCVFFYNFFKKEALIPFLIGLS